MAVSLKKYWSYLIALCLGLLALNIPLLRDFHLESALLAALVGCFWAGWKAAGTASKTLNDLLGITSVLGHLFTFASPLLAYAIFSGCFSIHGLGFWLLYPVPSVFFGSAIGRLFLKLKIVYSRLLTVLVLILIAIGGLLIEFYSFPQVYFFNHVWGGWPGPIYDETVEITGSLLYFRAITLFWILLLWYLPDFTTGKESRWVVVLAVLALVFSYLNLSEAGVISPRAHLQKELGSMKETPHFEIYYDADFYSADDIGRLALEHEFYLDQIADTLKLSKPDTVQKIESYLYAHPWQKKQLVGAKFTSYVPVWLEQDQLHIAKQQLGSLKHEMVHVMAKEFGNPLLNASWSIGLIEGLAVALAPDESSNSTIDQIVVSEKPYPSAAEMNRALSLLGFYGGRSGVNYTTSGSFVKYLLENYPVSRFKEAYGSGDIVEAYGLDLVDLVENWHQYLDTVTVDSLDQQIARRLFSMPSLFEKECPHVLSEFAEQMDRYLFYRAEKDTSRFLSYLDQAVGLRPGNYPLKTEWSFRNLEAGYHTKVVEQTTLQDSSAELQMLYADAWFLNNRMDAAKKHLDLANRLLKDDPDAPEMLNLALETRIDTSQWRHYVAVRYGKELPKQEFDKLMYRTKIRALQLAIESESWDHLRYYALRLLDYPVDLQYFNAYSSLLHMLAYLEEWELADRWRKKLQGLDFRQRYRERLIQQSEWIEFLQ